MTFNPQPYFPSNFLCLCNGSMESITNLNFMPTCKIFWINYRMFLGSRSEEKVLSTIFSYLDAIYCLMRL